MEVAELKKGLLSMSDLAVCMLSFLAVASGKDKIDPQYLGCYTLVRADSGLIHVGVTEIKNSTMTNSLCIKHCIHHRHPYAITSGEFCYCVEFGKELENYKTSEDKCNEQCPGDSSELCGNDDKFTLYRVCKNHEFGANCAKKCHCGMEESSECNPIDGTCRGGDLKCESGWETWPTCLTPMKAPKPTSSGSGGKRCWADNCEWLVYQLAIAAIMVMSKN